MTPGRELAALISGTGMPTPSDRELPLSVGSLLSQWDARCGSGSAAQPSNRVSDPLTTRERNVLAFISQGCSNTRRCPIGREGFLIREARRAPASSAVRNCRPFAQVSVCFFASPFDAPGDPPFGGSRERGGCAISMGEKKPQRPQWRHPPRRQRDVQRKCRSSSPRPNGDLAPALRLQRLSHFASKAQLRRCVGLKSQK